jgi:hypothetical protein
MLRRLTAAQATDGTFGVIAPKFRKNFFPLALYDRSMLYLYSIKDKKRSQK